jgi:hypothetical protein
MPRKPEIILNSSKFRCGALVVLDHAHHPRYPPRPILVPLQITAREVSMLAEKFLHRRTIRHDTTSDLWNQVCSQNTYPWHPRPNIGV